MRSIFSKGWIGDLLLALGWLFLCLFAFIVIGCKPKAEQPKWDEALEEHQRTVRAALAQLRAAEEWNTRQTLSNAIRNAVSLADSNYFASGATNAIISGGETNSITSTNVISIGGWTPNFWMAYRETNGISIQGSGDDITDWTPTNIALTNWTGTIQVGTNFYRLSELKGEK